MHPGVCVQACSWSPMGWLTLEEGLRLAEHQRQVSAT